MQAEVLQQQPIFQRASRYALFAACSYPPIHYTYFYLFLDHLVQSGDPTGTGRGGTSANGVLFGKQARYFDDEIKKHIRHDKKGVVGMAAQGPNQNASQFYITTTDEELDHLNEKRTIIGQVAEGFDVLDKVLSLLLLTTTPSTTTHLTTSTRSTSSTATTPVAPTAMSASATRTC